MNKYVTTYFRNVICAISSSLYDSIQIRVDYNDGAIVYLHGVEFFRANLPTDTIASSTLVSNGRVPDQS